MQKIGEAMQKPQDSQRQQAPACLNAEAGTKNPDIEEAEVEILDGDNKKSNHVHKRRLFLSLLL